MNGLVVMSYGTPGGPEEIEAYYTHVRRGRPPTPEALEDLRRRYEAIGGASPLAQRTLAQAAGIGHALGERQPGRWRVLVGSKHAPPFIEDAVEAMAGSGIRQGVGLVLAPHYSALSVGEYVGRARDAAERVGVELRFVQSWHLAPALVDLLAERLVEALASLPHEVRVATEVLVSAHSLPSRIVSMGDPYPAQLAETAEAICARAGLGHWRVAWQSAGRTAEPWLGPDILEVIRDLAAGGTRAVVVCPAGFSSDHLEVLYDVDIEARRVAEDCGVVLVRTRSLNDDPRLMHTLAELVMAASAA